MGVASTKFLRITDAVQASLRWINKIRWTEPERVRNFYSDLTHKEAYPEGKSLDDLITEIHNWYTAHQDCDWDYYDEIGDALDCFIADKFSNFLVRPDYFDEDFSSASTWDSFFSAEEGVIVLTLDKQD